MNPSNFSALILGAGLSSRMETPKPLLPLGDRTVIEKSISLFQTAGIGQIVVVLGHGARRIEPLLKKAHVRWTVNEDYRSGMFSSVQKGVASLPPCRAFFMLPADMPLVQAATLTALIDVLEASGKSICRPCYRGRRGHPPLIASSLIPAILDFKGTGGLRSLLSRYEERTAEVDCNDPGILIDLDTPEDYRRALAYHEDGLIPD